MPTIDSSSLGLLLGQPGECRLTLSSGNLLLAPLNGNRIGINGVLYPIPSSGITLAPTSTTPGTTYYIYVYDNAGTLTLERSTTTHATDTTTGYEIKSGDATRSLVGMARVVSGPSWADSETQRFLLSWFNPRLISLANQFTSQVTTTSTSWVELSSSEGRVEFLIWSGRIFHAHSTGQMHLAGGTYQSQWMALGIDGTTPERCIARWDNNDEVSTGTCVISKRGLSEGYHYVTILGQVAVGTGKWDGTASSYDCTNIGAFIEG